MQLRTYQREIAVTACEDGKIALETRVYKAKSYEDFVLDNPDFKHLSRKKYNQWIQSYADFLGKKYESSQDSFGRFFEIKEDIKVKTGAKAIF